MPPRFGAIVAAVASETRERLLSRLTAADLPVAAVVADQAQLRDALDGAASGSWLAAGGDPSSVRAFAQIAVEAGQPFILLMNDAEVHSLRGWPLAQGGAVLHEAATAAALQAALAAVRSGLIVLTPGLSSPGEAVGLRSLPLSPREREILAAAAAGASTKAIARLLDLSPNTVKFHLQAAFEKLGAATRTEAVVIAVRRGELSI